MHITTLECRICLYHYSLKREHCPICVARRIFIGSHSYEPYRMTCSARNADGVELVRAIRSDFGFDAISAR